MGRDWAVLLVCALTLPLLVRASAFRRALVWALPMGGIGLLVIHADATPSQRLLAASAGMLYAMKGAILASYPLAEARKNNPLAFLIWPGMDPERLAKRGTATDRDADPLARGLFYLYAGLALLLLGTFAPLAPQLASWLGVVALLLAIHFGLSEVLSSMFMLSGRSIRPLFDRPFAAQTLNVFWSKRWNVAFVEMDRRLFLPALLRRFGYRGAIFGVFLISGLLHEMAISYPAGGGWGLPLCYFALQGALLLVERQCSMRSKVFVWLSILLPLPILFTGPFRREFIEPILASLHRALVSHPIAWYYDRGLWVMAAAHFLVLVASFQVPTKLRWKEELPRLSAFNRKLMYAYGAFIVFTIITFGLFTLILHNDLLAGSPAAVFFAAFITAFWLLRIGLDTFYYKHEDWPKGTQFVVGHALLTSLFLFLSLTYGGLVVWHLPSALLR